MAFITTRKMIPLSFDRKKHEEERSSFFWTSKNGDQKLIKDINPVHLRNIERLIVNDLHDSIKTSHYVYSTIVNEKEYKIKVLNDKS
tara:strand:- start:188 stop:448 length:261 start_codon:yes stop_codon:yes gene_type:complete